MQSKAYSIRSQGTRLFVASLALACSAAFISVAQAQPQGGSRGSHAAMHGGMGGGRMLEHALDGVNASPEQRTRIRDIIKSAAADVRAQRQASRGLREQAMTLFTQPTVDARAVETLRQQMVQQHDQSSRRWMQALLDASAVLTPEQRTQLAERMKQRRELGERHQRERRALEQPTR